MQRLIMVTLEKDVIRTVLELHQAVFDHIRRNVTYKELNLNNYILVKTNYLPVESLADLEDEQGGDGGLILVSKSQFVQMIDSIKLESERFKLNPTQRFSQLIKEKFIREEKEREEFEHTERVKRFKNLEQQRRYMPAEVQQYQRENRFGIAFDKKVEGKDTHKSVMGNSG